ncbi:MAG: SagB/ThcOx family dehydrogenase [Firmicutes bacterium]|nr:SagB/ThcOx family dehydrogenase [Bacillota bacterium]
MKKNIGQEFVEKTKYQYLGISDQEKELPQPPLAWGAEGANCIDLPRPETLAMPAVDLTQAIEARKTWRKYTGEPLSLAELSYLLWATQGVKQVTSRPTTLRTVPSAGARHPLETFILVNQVEGLRPGLYRYLALEHQLAEVCLEADVRERLVAACGKQVFVGTSAVTFFWVADAYRSVWRYQERAYRYIYLDAGHVCQNLYLAAQVVGGGCCAVGAYNDDQLNAELGLNGVDHFVVYAATVGKINT